MTVMKKLHVGDPVISSGRGVIVISVLNRWFYRLTPAK